MKRVENVPTAVAPSASAETFEAVASRRSRNIATSIVSSTTMARKVGSRVSTNVTPWR